MIHEGDSAIVLPGISPNELKTYVHTKTCKWILIAALVTDAKIGSNQDVLQWVNG